MKVEHVRHWFSSEEKFLRTPVGIFLVGAFLGELAPDPTDAIHFWLVAHVLRNPETPRSLFILLQIFDWYFLSASYFLLLLIIAYVLHIHKVKIIHRISVIGGVLSIGAAVGIIARFAFGG